MFDVTVTGFSGPLDMLLVAVERGDLDIVTIALGEMARRYLAGMHAAAPEEPDAVAGFIRTTAHLIYLKSCALLPPPPVVAQHPDDEPSPEDLEALLDAYRQFKAAVDGFREREGRGLRSFPRLAPPLAPPPSPGLGNVTLDRLLTIVQEALRRLPAELPDAAPRETITVRDRIVELQGLLAAAGQTSFRDFIAASRTRQEIVVGFMAVLELIKRGRAAAEQPEPFGDILIVARTPATVAAD